ncbi:SsgA family sporulation/cell division regulator [Streptomyces phyllanthi]|uniref:SsgA family sporulation/cell division regulator n=1 Tax=Streptomyces phyllanthi TaxID=1803180 RepID=A0A5N8WHI4_9ACTN|nr:SsgA family sporulation/cell division regulator [Streptomyces phyllanthi]MPY46592.1 SsgA family sporulation/cell division regulator [Streptomyces phyllanthi]
MTVTVKQSTRACLITPDYRELPVAATLRFTSADPLAVHVDFPADASADDQGVTWTFARVLLEEGIGAPAGIGDVHIWPCGPATTVMEFYAPPGMVMIRFGTAALHEFLVRSYAVVEPGTENLEPALDDLTSLLGRSDAREPRHGRRARAKARTRADARAKAWTRRRLGSEGTDDAGR